MKLALTRQEVFVEVCDLLKFFVLCIDKYEYFQSGISTSYKEAGAYRCGLSVTHNSLDIHLQTKRSRTTAHSIYIRYDYMSRFNGNGWYLASTPYRYGKQNVFTGVSTSAEVLSMGAFDLVTYAVFKEQHLMALHKTLLEWKKEYEAVMLEFGLTLELTGVLRGAKFV